MTLVPAKLERMNEKKIKKGICVAVIAWQGYEESAEKIKNEVAPLVDQVIVVYSNPENKVYRDTEGWHLTSNKGFFGAKFSHALGLCEFDTLLLVHADTKTNDWKKLTEFFIDDSLQFPRMGLWIPLINYTFFNPDRVTIHSIGKYTLVSATDSIILGIAPPILKRLSSLDFSDNNLGWGLDWIASAYALNSGLCLVRNDKVEVFHPRGSGYSNELARTQMARFLKQATEAERRTITRVKRYIMRNEVSMSKRELLLVNLRMYVISLRSLLSFVLNKQVFKSLREERMREGL